MKYWIPKEWSYNNALVCSSVYVYVMKIDILSYFKVVSYLFSAWWKGASISVEGCPMSIDALAALFLPFGLVLPKSWHFVGFLQIGSYDSFLKLENRDEGHHFLSNGENQIDCCRGYSPELGWWHHHLGPILRGAGWLEFNMRWYWNEMVGVWEVCGVCVCLHYLSTNLHSFPGDQSDFIVGSCVPFPVALLGFLPGLPFGFACAGPALC